MRSTSPLEQITSGPHRPPRYGHFEAEHSPCGPKRLRPYGHVEAKHRRCGPHRPHRYVEAELHAAHNVHTDVDTLGQSTMRPTTPTPVWTRWGRAPCGPQRPPGMDTLTQNTMRPTTPTRYGHVDAEHHAAHNAHPMWTR
ncbi:hypothetical protein PTSG_06752 [Salpingoeca rosetta]|uniref:Uncharacterized protein n=1 Tax=Salpingoeca rosetta (strain ATCC 50818 / BSB-021) TaxID=946362 RepID=F2UEP7_SALR5|nr:uncharacterized protein PTSG_06752 [Salpingoeca rosetta]EGD75097.1 hypothetical protein PTSG_06752 [Salpingoeca rosetta]|eukprot:XP_004992150.1 hypothetical protein PTSG_06752 [Salpingoeca rosetta]